MPKKHKAKLIDDNVYVLRDDYTYSIIDNSDMSIIRAASSKHTKFLLFPVNSINGTKYMLERAECVPHNVKLHIQGTLSFVMYGDDIVDMSDGSEIELTSNTISEYYAVMGSIYNMEVCTYMLDTQSYSYETRPALSSFLIQIENDGIKYELDPDIFQKASPYDEFSILNQLDGTIMPLYDLINYIEHTVSGKGEYDNVVNQYKSFMLYDDGTYSRLQAQQRSDRYLIKAPNLDKKTDKDRLNSSVVVLDTDTPLYIAVPYNEFDAFRSDSVYTMSYVIYYNEASNLNSIPDTELSVDVILEIDGMDYNVLYNDDMQYTTINQFMFTLMSLKDIDLILWTIYPWEEPGLSNICYTAFIDKSYDKNHKCKISQSTLSKFIRDGDDMIHKITSDVHTHELMGENVV
jgi:hypothetical protein